MSYASTRRMCWRWAAMIPTEAWDVSGCLDEFLRAEVPERGFDDRPLAEEPGVALSASGGETRKRFQA